MPNVWLSWAAGKTAFDWRTMTAAFLTGSSGKRILSRVLSRIPTTSASRSMVRLNADQSTDAFKPKAHARLRRRQFKSDDEEEGKAFTSIRHPGLDDADGLDFKFMFQSEIGDAEIISRSRIERKEPAAFDQFGVHDKADLRGGLETNICIGKAESGGFSLFLRQNIELNAGASNFKQDGTQALFARKAKRKYPGHACRSA